MKAASLPINIIIIFLIALVVLAIIAVFFMGGIREQETSMDKGERLNQLCVAWKAQGCTTADPGFSLTIGGVEHTTSTVCTEAGLSFTAGVENTCHQYCCGSSD